MDKNWLSYEDKFIFISEITNRCWIQTKNAQIASLQLIWLVNDVKLPALIL